MPAGSRDTCRAYVSPAAGVNFKPPAAFVLAAEFGHLAALPVDDDARQIGRLIGRGEGLEVHAIRHAGDQVAPFGIHGQIDRLQQISGSSCWRSRPLRRLRSPSPASLRRGGFRRAMRIRPTHRRTRRPTVSPRKTSTVVDPGDDGHFGPGGDAPLGPRDFQRGGDVISRPVTVAQEFDLAPGAGAGDIARISNFRSAGGSPESTWEMRILYSPPGFRRESSS